MARRQHDRDREARGRVQSHGRRRENQLDQRLLVIIACEGEKTERLYFEAWFTRLRDARRLSPQSCVIAPHDHTNPMGVLADLRSYRAGGVSFRDFKHRWIVIDRDAERTNGGGHTIADFNTALQQASSQRPKVQVAWSNPCFEIWYLLHFRYQNTGTDRDRVQDQLSDALGVRYEKNCANMLELTHGKLGDALRNARRLYEEFQSSQISADQSNPCTTVYELIELMQKIEAHS